MRQAVSVGLLLLCLGTVQGGGRRGAEPALTPTVRSPVAGERLAAYIVLHRRARLRLQVHP